MIWQIRDVAPDTKARIKARAAIHNHSIAEELADMEATLTRLEHSMAPLPKAPAPQPLQVNPKAHNYTE